MPRPHPFKSQAPANLGAGPRRPIRLAPLLATTMPPPADAVATGCCSHAAAVRPGDVFVSTEADAVTLDRLVRVAVGRGASAVVSEQLTPTPGVPQFVVADSHEAFGAICHALLRRPDRSLPLQVVAGRRGKSTTLHWLRAIYRCAGAPVAFADDGVLDDGLLDSETHHAEAAGGSAAGGQGGARIGSGPRWSPDPSPASIARWLARGEAAGCDAAIAAAPAPEHEPGLRSPKQPSGGALAGATLHTLCHVGPPTAIDGSLLGRLAERGTLVTPVGLPADHGGRPLLDDGLRAFTYGFDPSADLRATVIDEHPAGQTLVLAWGSSSVAVELRAPGRPMAQSAVAAAAVALSAGVPLRVAARGLECTPPPPRRMQTLAAGQPFAVYLDNALTASGAADATGAIAPLTAGRLITVAPTVSAAEAARRASGLVIAPRHAEEADRPSGVAVGSGAGVGRLRLVDSRFSAIALALALAEPGDAVLLLGCRPPGASVDDGAATRDDTEDGAGGAPNPPANPPADDEAQARGLIALRLAAAPSPPQARSA